MLHLFLESAWKVAAAGVLLGAGIPFLFAIGIRETVGTGDTPSRPSPVRLTVGVVCFLVVIGCVAAGLTVIVASGLGKQVSFDHVYPTVSAKS